MATKVIGPRRPSTFHHHQHSTTIAKTEERTSHSNRKPPKLAGNLSPAEATVQLQSRATGPQPPAQGALGRSKQESTFPGPQGSWESTAPTGAEVLFLPTSQSTFTIYQVLGALTALRTTRERSIGPSKDSPCPHAEVSFRHKSR